MPTGIITWIGSDYTLIRTELGGTVRADFRTDLKRGNKITFTPNGVKNDIINIESNEYEPDYMSWYLWLRTY